MNTSGILLMFILNLIKTVKTTERKHKFSVLSHDFHTGVYINGRFRSCVFQILNKETIKNASCIEVYEVYLYLNNDKKFQNLNHAHLTSDCPARLQC